MGLPAIRVTSYPVTFAGTTYDIQLRHTLSADYFVMVEFGAQGSSIDPGSAGARVTHDPHGSGNLTRLSKNAIRLTRGIASSDWVGVVHVVECLRDRTGAGFRLVDVVPITMPAPGVSGAQTDTEVGGAWTTLARVTLFGGHRGGGISCSSADPTEFQTLGIRLVPSSTSTLTWRRYGKASASLQSANATVYVVEWGDEWTVQRANVAGSNGGGGLDATGEWNTATITSTTRASTWVWGCGTSQEDGAGESFAALALTLGDGVTAATAETKVAAALPSAATVDAEVWAMSHPLLAASWAFDAFPTWTGGSPRSVASAAPSEGEWYPAAGSPWGEAATSGYRLPQFSGGPASTSAADFSLALIGSRITSASAVSLTRGSGSTTAAGGWRSLVDFGAVVTADVATDGDDATGPDQSLVLPDRNAPGSLISATTSAGYSVGPAVGSTSNRGNLVGIAYGVPTEDSEIDIEVTRGGALGTRAAYVRKRSSDAASAWCGTDVPTFFSDAGSPAASGGNDTLGFTPYAAGGTFSQVYNREIVVAIGSGLSGIRVYYRDVDEENGDSATWTYVGIVPGTTAGIPLSMAPVVDVDTGVDVCELADGRLLMLYAKSDATSTYDVGALMSADGGATWTVAAVRLGSVAEGASWGAADVRSGIRLSRSGQWIRACMIVGVQNNSGANRSLRTWVSGDDGASWRSLTDVTIPPRRGVSPASNAVPGDYPFDFDGIGDPAGTFVLAAFEHNTSPSDTIRTWSAVADEDWVEVSTSTLTVWGGVFATGFGVAVAMHAERLMIYVLVTNISGNVGVLAGYAIDPADVRVMTNWTDLGKLADFDSLPGYIPAYLKGYSAGHHVSLLGARFDATATASNPFVTGLVHMRAGGWSRHPWNYAQVRAGSRPLTWYDSARSTEFAWWAWMRPPYLLGGLWSRVTNAATNTESGRSVGGTTSSTAGYSYQRLLVGTPGSTEDEWSKHALHWRMKVTSTRADVASAEDTGLRVVSYDGADLSIRVGTDKIVIYDNNGATTLATLSTTNTDEWTEFRLAIVGNQCFLAYRPVLGRTDTAWTSTAALNYTVAAGSPQEVRIGILAAAGSSGTSTYEASEFAVSYRDPMAQNFADLTIPDNLPGQLVEHAPFLVRHGLWLGWGGSGGVAGDEFTMTLDHSHGLDALELDSPRFDWRSVGLGESSLVLRAGTASDSARFEVDAVVLVGTVDRTARIQLHTADSWSSPAVDVEISADIIEDLTVTDVDGACVKVAAGPGSRVPTLGEAGGLYLRLLSAGTHTGKTFAVLQDVDRGAGWLQVVDGTDLSAHGVAAGVAACLFGDRMIWRSSAKRRYKYARITFPDVSAVLSDLGTATGDHRLGARVVGFAVPFDVPLEWSFADREAPLVEETRTEGGVSVAVRRGPPARLYEGRVFGDLDEFRRSLRGVLRAHAGYSERCGVLVLDARRVHAETVLYGRWTSSSSMAEAAWYRDANDEWRTAGDVDVVFSEVT